MQYCVLTHKTDKELTELNERVYDQGGYFIIDGSEKVLTGQERMSNNHVYCFRLNAASKYSWACETRSHVEHGVRPTSTMYVLRNQKSGGKSAITGNQIRAGIPYICYDFSDAELMERFKIGRRGSAINMSKADRIRYAQDIHSTEGDASPRR